MGTKVLIISASDNIDALTKWLSSVLGPNITVVHEQYGSKTSEAVTTGDVVAVIGDNTCKSIGARQKIHTLPHATRWMAHQAHKPYMPLWLLKWRFVRRLSLVWLEAKVHGNMKP